ncbi:hypothetical protein O3M35_001008 [Rhynocoris fuscipes]|uniref:J domain-containing protein n=1 Tax=Rhynocoris fuscipes TaxID=488301 RepID=A0AAW1DQS3_9HEMI
MSGYAVIYKNQDFSSLSKIILFSEFSSFYLQKNHPDKHLNDPSMHERFIRINEAYSVLINPLSRRAYDINLHQKKKLGAPTAEKRYQHHHTTTNSTTYESKSSQSSSKTSYNTSSSNSGSNYSHGDPFTFHYQASGDKQSSKEEAYYGVKGVKKTSNRKIVSIVLLTSLFAAIIQYISIRQRLIKSREEALERSRKYALHNAMAREKAKLYGTDYQINLLKKSLKNSVDPEDETPKSPTDDSSSNNIHKQSSEQRQPTNPAPETVAGPPPAKKCKKCNSKKVVN